LVGSVQFDSPCLVQGGVPTLEANLDLPVNRF